jgi:hypothetical protein
MPPAFSPTLTLPPVAVQYKPSWHLRAAGLILVILLLGYLSFGKSFGYIGYYPILIGEAGLFGAVAFLAMDQKLYFPRTLSAWLLFPMLLAIVAQAVYSVWYLQQPIVEVGRGIAPFYYAAFAFCTFIFLTRYRRYGYGRLIPSQKAIDQIATMVLGIQSISLLASTVAGNYLPIIPHTGVPILYYKPGDASMVLLVLLVLANKGRLNTFNACWALMLLLIACAESRSVLLCTLTAAFISWRPKPRQLIAITVFVVLGVAVALSGFTVKLNYREISAERYLLNITSIFDPEKAAEIDPQGQGTKRWRLMWWTKIFDNAVETPYVFIGAGWGENLAVQYGIYRISSSGWQDAALLRNPHNIFFSTLGRGGWIVTGLWCLFYLTFVPSLLVGRFGRRGKSPEWKLMAEICLVFTLAALINGGTDVFLESPQNSIPHWLVIGLGWRLLLESRRKSSPSYVPQQIRYFPSHLSPSAVR